MHGVIGRDVLCQRGPQLQRAFLEHEGQLEAGVVYNPCLDELFIAERGKGATLNDKPIKVSTIPTLRESLLVTGFHPKVVNSLDDISSLKLRES